MAKEPKIKTEKSDDLVRLLHPHEQQIIAALHELGSATPAEIAEKTGLPEASVHKAGLWSKVKGLVSHEDTTAATTALTPEGKEYAAAGIPEKQLLRLVVSGVDTIPALREKLPQLDIALGWARRKKWIEINSGKLTLTSEGKRATRAETAIETALKTGAPTPATHEELKSRKLIEITERTTKRMELTPAGKRAAKVLPKHDAVAAAAGQLTPEDLRSGAWQKKQYRPYDLSAPVPGHAAGRFHPYMSYLQRIREQLVAQGFQEARGPIVETEFWNADALFMPQDHPARGLHDVFFVKEPKTGSVPPVPLALVGKTHANGWVTNSRGWGAFDANQSKNLLLRSQTTAVSARTLASKPQHAKWFSIGRNFRPDVLDATHSAEFFQCDCIVTGDGLNLRHLYAYLELFAKQIAGATEIRFRPSYFPFVEPGVEVDAKIGTRWIEVAGAGIFRPEVTQPLGESRPVLAWAFGLDRLAMRALDVPDIRQFYQPDLAALRNARAVL